MKLVLSILLLLVSSGLFGQKGLYLSPYIGYGGTYPFEYFDLDDGSNFCFGGEVYFFSEQSIYYGHTSLFYQRYWNQSNVFNYLKLPLSGEVKIGEKLFFTLGAGVTFFSMLDYQWPHKPASNKVYPFGLEINFHTGLGIPLKSNILLVKVNGNGHLTPSTSYEFTSPGGSTYTEHEYFKSYYFSLSYLFKLDSSSKNKK